MPIRGYPTGENWDITREVLYAPPSHFGVGGYGVDEYTKLMLHCNGDDGSTTFTDDCWYAKTITANNGASIDTAKAKFGSASGLFQASADYLNVTHNDFDIGSSLFTIDLWVWVNSVVARTGLLCTLQTVPANRLGWTISLATPTTVTFRYYTAGNTNHEINRSSGDDFAGAWHHVAVVKKGTGASDLGIAINGSFEWFDGNFTIASSNTLCIGREFADYDGYYLNGWLDEIRFSLGVARWTADFDPTTFSQYGPPDPL